jgi:hypothetical protein
MTLWVLESVFGSVPVWRSVEVWVMAAVFGSESRWATATWLGMGWAKESAWVTALVLASVSATASKSEVVSE